jgi:membrane protein DedA with SNARE-associated domain
LGPTGRGLIPDWALTPKFMQIVTVSAVVIVVVPFFLLRDSLSSLSQMGYFGIFIASFVGSASIVLPTPSLAVILAGGLLWNPFIVGIVGGVGMTLGEITGYALGYSGKGLLEKYPRLAILDKWMLRFGGPIIFVMAIIPSPFFDVVGFLAGSHGYPLSRFFLWSLPGKTIKGLVFAYLGSNAITPILEFFVLPR